MGVAVAREENDRRDNDRRDNDRRDNDRRDNDRWDNDRRDNDRWDIAGWPATAAGLVPAVLSAVLLGLICAGGLGCVGYRFGPQAFFRPDIRTIHVPIVRNETFRHDLGVRLTETLIREIQQRTPYIVTGDPNADSVLTCRFDSDTKRVLTETRTDEVRALETLVTVQASWISRRGEVLMQNRLLPEGSLAIMFSQDSRVVPEAGQSIESELQEAIENLAERIVSQMEARWE